MTMTPTLEILRPSPHVAETARHIADVRAGAETARHIADVRAGAEGREGVAAFLARCEASWRGASS